MPFVGETDNNDPGEIKLTQIGPNLFRLEQGFRYRALDEPSPFPVFGGTETDLASAKWPIWWLIASYGTHTKASLLHDILIEPACDYPRSVSRQRADALFFAALRESAIGPVEKRKRPSFMRRWLMYSAVATLGTMRAESRGRLALLLAQAGLLVLLVIVGVARTLDVRSPVAGLSAWLSDAATFTAEGVVTLLVFALFSPIVAIAAIGSSLEFWTALPAVHEFWPLSLWYSAAVLAVTGIGWGFLIPKAPRRLAMGIWPCAVFSAFFVLPAVVAVVLSSLVVAFVDLVYNLICAAPAVWNAIRHRSAEALKDALRGTAPVLRPYRLPGRFP